MEARAASPSPSYGYDDGGSPRSQRSPSVRRCTTPTAMSIRRSRSRPAAPLSPAVQMHQDNTLYLSASGEPCYTEKCGSSVAYSVTPVCSALLSHSRPVGGDAFFRGIAKVRDAVWVAETDGSITVRELDTAEVKKVLQPLENTQQKHMEGGVHVTRDGSRTKSAGNILVLSVVNDRVWGGANDGKVHIYTFAGRREKEMKHHSGPVNHIAHSNGNVFSASCDFKIAHWDATTLSFVRLLHGHKLPVRCLCLAGDILFSGSDDRTINIWSTSWASTPHGSASSSSALLKTLTGHRGDVLCLERCKGNIWSGSTDCSIRVWSVHSGDCKAVLPHHTGWVHTLKEMGGRMWSASHDGSVCIWSGKTVSLLHRLDPPHQGLLHCFCIARSTTTRRLWTVGGDQTVRFWDIKEGDRPADEEHWEELFTARQKTLELEKNLSENYARHVKMTEMLESAHTLLVKEKQERESAVDRAAALQALLESRDDQIHGMIMKNTEMHEQYAKMRTMSQSFRENVELMLRHQQEASAPRSLLAQLQELQEENDRLHDELSLSTGGALPRCPAPGTPLSPAPSPDADAKCRELEAEVCRLSQMLEHRDTAATTASASEGRHHHTHTRHGEVQGAGVQGMMESAVRQLSRKCSVLSATLPHLDELIRMQPTEPGSPRASIESVRALVEAEAADLGVSSMGGGGGGSRSHSHSHTVRREALFDDVASPGGASGGYDPLQGPHDGADADPLRRRECAELEREVQRLQFELDKTSTSSEIRVAQLREHLADREEELRDARDKLGHLQQQKMQLVYERSVPLSVQAEAVGGGVAGEGAPSSQGEAESADELVVVQQIRRDSLELELAAAVAEKAIVEKENDSLQQAASELKAVVSRLQAEIEEKEAAAAEWEVTLSKVEGKIRSSEQSSLDKVAVAQNEANETRMRVAALEGQCATAQRAVTRCELHMSLSLLSPLCEVELHLAATTPGGEPDIRRGTVMLPVPPPPRRVTLLTPDGPQAFAFDDVASLTVLASRGNLREHAAALHHDLDEAQAGQLRHAVESAALKLIPGMDAEIDVRSQQGSVTTIRGRVLKYSFDEALATPDTASIPLELRSDGDRDVAGDVKSYPVSSFVEVRSAVRDFHSFYSKIARIREEKRVLEERLRDVEAEAQRHKAEARQHHHAAQPRDTPREPAPDPALIDGLRRRLSDAEAAVGERDGLIETLSQRLAAAVAAAATAPAPAPAPLPPPTLADPDTPAVSQKGEGEAVEVAVEAMEVETVAVTGMMSPADRELLLSELTALVENYKVVVSEVEAENAALSQSNAELKKKNAELKQQMVSRVKVIEEGLAAARAAKERGGQGGADAPRLKAEAEALRRELEMEVAAREGLVQEMQLLKEELTISKNKAQQLSSRVEQFDDYGVGKKSSTDELAAAHQTINSLYAELQQATSQISVLQEAQEGDRLALQRSLEDEREKTAAARDANQRQATWLETELNKELQSRDTEIERLRHECEHMREREMAWRRERERDHERAQYAVMHTPEAPMRSPQLEQASGEVTEDMQERRERHERRRRQLRERGDGRHPDTPQDTRQHPDMPSPCGQAAAEVPRMALVPAPVPSPTSPAATSSSSVRRAQEARQHLHELRAQVDEAQRRATATQEAAEELRVQTRQLVNPVPLPNKVSVLRTIRFKSGKGVERGSVGTVLREGDAPDTLRVQMDEGDVLYDFKASDVTPHAPASPAMGSSPAPVAAGGVSPPAVSPSSPQVGPMVRLREPVQSGTKTWKRGAWAHVIMQDGEHCALQLVHPNGVTSAPPLFAHKVPNGRVERVYLPQTLHVHIPGKRPASGVYTLAEGVLLENNPTWQAGDRLLQTNQYGAWIIGERSELAHGVGWAVSKAPHQGRMPQEVDVWQTFGDPSEPWADDPGVYVQERPQLEATASTAGGRSSQSKRNSIRTSRSPSPLGTPAGRTLSPLQEAQRAAEALSKLELSGNWRQRATRARSLSQQRGQ